jgi:hypothetical protein
VGFKTKHKQNEYKQNKTKYMPIGDTARNLQLEDGKGTISYVN